MGPTIGYTGKSKPRSLSEGLNPLLFVSPTLAGRFFTTVLPGKLRDSECNFEAFSEDSVSEIS